MVCLWITIHVQYDFSEIKKCDGYQRFALNGSEKNVCKVKATTDYRQVSYIKRTLVEN